MPQPHEVFEVWTPDEVAECWEQDDSGLGLYKVLWSLVEHYSDTRTPEEMETPPDPDNDNVLAKPYLWDRLTEEQQVALNKAAQAREEPVVYDYGFRDQYTPRDHSLDDD